MKIVGKELIKLVVPTGFEPVTKELCYTTIVFTTIVQLDFSFRLAFRLATYRLDNICGLDYAFTVISKYIRNNL